MQGRCLLQRELNVVWLTCGSLLSVSADAKQSRAASLGQEIALH
jgi:hypothetical protein